MTTQRPGASQQQCPVCGETAEGKFCSSCGTPLRGASCPSCQAPLSPGARFCHLCGAPLGARQTRGKRSTPWLVAGAGVVVVIAVLVLAALRGPGATPTAAAPPPAAAGAASAGGASGPDLANMSPRERADRLYDRIMRAHERGDTAEVKFFKPMVIQAYAMLGDLDDDARYHVGLIHALTGEPQTALAQADSMDQGHLLAALLRQRVALASGDAAASRQAYQDFLASYESEIETDRPEYEAHRTLLESFLAEARREIGSGEGR